MFESTSEFKLVDQDNTEYFIYEFGFIFQVNTDHRVSLIHSIRSNGDLSLDDGTVTLTNGLMAANGTVGLVVSIVPYNIPNVLFQFNKI